MCAIPLMAGWNKHGGPPAAITLQVSPSPQAHPTHIHLMFIIFLRFSANKDNAAQHMDGHKAWLKRGFTDGVFLLAGSLEPGLGGGILAHQTTLASLDQRVKEDPFVIAGVVQAEIHELDPGMADERLQFLIS